jgi:hypothetical protein
VYPSGDTLRDRPELVTLSRTAAAWALGYALYRGYYALGGTWAILGIPVSYAQWIRINAIAAGMLLVAAAAPLALLAGWQRRGARPFLLAIAWLVSVGCVSHATIAMPTRVFSLLGLLTIEYPFWQTIDARKADLQDLWFNEPWFLGEGVLWAGIAWYGALRGSARRTWWIGSALVVITLATALGLLTSFGVIGSVIVG